MTRNLFRTGMILVLALLLTACETPPMPAPFVSPFDSPLVPEATSAVAEQLPAPEAGMATLSGQLFSTTGQAVIPGTAFYLTPAQPAPEAGTDLVLVLKGPDLTSGDIIGKSDDKGNFTLTNVSPGDYYLAVWAPYNWLPIPADAADTLPRVFNIKAGDRLDVGRLEMAWP